MDEIVCDDPTCTDPTLDRSHSHDYVMEKKKVDITNFIYNTTVLFNSNYVLVLLN